MPLYETRRATKIAPQKKRFPLGELATQRAVLQQEYLSKSKKLSALRKKLERIKRIVSLLITDVDNASEFL